MNNKLTFMIGLLLTCMLFSTAYAAEVEEGMLAPDFSIKRLNGSEFKLSDFRGKKAVHMVFWTTWCTYCMTKIPALKYSQNVLGKQIEIIAIDTSVRDTLAKAYRFQKDREINYPLAFDFGKNVTDLYGVWGTPTEFIIDINGVVIHRDGVPKNISEHLSNWNMIDHHAKQKQLLAERECNKEQRIC
jgi:peroxiredoxin